MWIRIEAASGIPITRQIMDQVRSRCVAGILKPGDRLPSVRELARELAVNQNTILRAYERLTAEGVLVMRQGEGTFVAEFGAGEQLPRERAAVAEEIERAFRRGAALGMKDEELRSLAEETLARLASKERNVP